MWSPVRSAGQDEPSPYVKKETWHETMLAAREALMGQQDRAGRHILSPGLIETVRMYSEGLGKVTGTEALWPGWGY